VNVVVSQALATGAPVLVTNHSGLPEQVIDGQCGLVAREGDPDDLAQKLRWLLEHPERWPEFGRAGRAQVEAHYDSAKLISQQLEDYHRLIAGFPPQTSP
jgi:colanic acid/amylovoran biosynthesis glycosyltransferase